MGLLFWVTDLGPGLSGDSRGYFETARSLLQGYGFQDRGMAMTHHAPGYPVLVAAATLIDGDMMRAARWLHVFFYGTNILLITAAAYVSSRENALAVLFSVLAIISSGDLLVVYSTAQSESPFIAFALASFIFLSIHIATQRWSRLVASAVFLGLAMATRYVGVTLLPPILICLFLMDRQPMAHRVRKCVFLSCVALLPLAAWVLRNLMVTGSTTDRTLLFHPVSLDQVKQGILTMCNFYFPSQFINSPVNMPYLNAWLKLALLVFIGVFVAIQFYRHDLDARAKTFQTLAIMFCATYVSFILLSISFFDASTPLDSRILSPVFVFSLIAVVSLCSANRRWIRRLSVTFLFAVLFANAPHEAAVATDLHQNGWGYSGREWRESKTVDFVRSFGTALTVYSNGPDAIYLLTGRRAEWVPAKLLSVTNLIPAKDFVPRTWAMCDDIAYKGAIVVYFNDLLSRIPLLTEEELQEACDVSVIHRFPDGVIYGK